MTAHDPLTLKTIILHGQSTDASALPEFHLLNQLGHEIATTGSASEAVELLQHDRADLVVIDADTAGQHDFVARLTGIPADQQPKQVAIFSDGADESLKSLVCKVQRSRVHVFLKPLHMHGLLNVLRKLDGRSSFSPMH